MAASWPVNGVSSVAASANGPAANAGASLVLATVMVRTAVAEAFAASVTCTVKEFGPTFSLVGVPENAPVLETVSQAGPETSE